MDVGDDKLHAPPDHATGRGDRLAAALRANLAKRKAQGRERARDNAAAAGENGLRNAVPAGSPQPQPPGHAEPAPHDSAEIIAEKSADQAN